MSQKNDNFFDEKKEWSIIKDELLGCYLKPYFAKIIHAKSPIIYIDCFAGKGIFNDGKDGSPLIALNIIDEAINNSGIKTPPVFTYFIDLNYAKDLKKNLPVSNYKRSINIIDGKYEDNISKILKKVDSSRVFLYIDPYGIKALNTQQLCSLIDNYNLKGVEALINFNSFGFYRQACNVMKHRLDNTIKEMSEFLIEYDSSNVDSEEDLNTIFGSTEWKEIIAQNKNIFETEIRLSEAFCKNLKSGYKYVLNMPIRRGNEVKPKYRMVYVTNHEDGCLIMADNMYIRSQKSRLNRLNGQMSLFELDVNDNDIMEGEIESNLLDMVKEKYIDCKELFCNYYMTYGITTSISELFKILRKNKDKIIVKRNPPVTKTGKASNYWNFGSGDIYVKRA